VIRIYDADLAFQRRVANPYGGPYVPGPALSPDGTTLVIMDSLVGMLQIVTMDLR
jgi:hypothetical protein